MEYMENFLFTRSLQGKNDQESIGAADQIIIVHDFFTVRAESVANGQTVRSL
jgi:hypothetical protein